MKLTLTAPAGQVDAMSDFLAEQGALAVSLQDAGEQPLFQEALHETPLWQATQIQALFDEDAPLAAMICELQSALGIAVAYQIEPVQDEDWVQNTQKNFPPLWFAQRLLVAPPWAPVEAGVTAWLRLNPGLGFGTGAHPTTSMCLTWLAQQDLVGKIVLDYGCGSGILGLAALALGAKEVWAVDHDPQALIATRNNAELNSFLPQALHIVLPEQLPAVQADIILANILANPLCELAPRMIDRLAPQGRLVLSGFLTAETERVRNAYCPPLQLEDIVAEQDWVRLVVCFP